MLSPLGANIVGPPCYNKVIGCIPAAFIDLHFEDNDDDQMIVFGQQFVELFEGVVS